MVLAAAFGQVGFPVEHVYGVVVGEVLLGGVVADVPAGVRVAAQGECQGAYHDSGCRVRSRWCRVDLKSAECSDGRRFVALPFVNSL